ncbi:2-phospho-L-lactate guanylyltransferase [Curtobacterium ammoniigenes]|uniref:2-phospho-L-lactate guanylyltransferase n=1 Tax=Curtobacterium ammoniigenes TaxID=395387 RepID=UPI00083339F5|nr:2-phospho-L-lactate guanylyltransferase [Curtobacterium ammoniigenes]
MTAWTVLIPVKGTAAAKRRLGATAEQALAIALDTVAAAVPVADVVVVTAADPALFRPLGARVLTEPKSIAGLNAALRWGLERMPEDQPTACLQGDLPALRPDELRRALAAAGRYERAIVPDASGTGTVLLTARRADAITPMFGIDSARAHERAAFVRLALSDIDGLRQDVDTPADLVRVDGRVGERTARAFGIRPRSVL